MSEYTDRLNDDDDGDDEEEEEDDGEKHWYYPRTSSPHSSLSVNNSFTHQSSSATIGSWGFDINRSTNVQTPSSSLTTNNNINSNSDQQTMMRTTTKDYSERLIDIPSSSSPSKIRSPTLTKQRDGNEFAAIDRLVLGPNRMTNGSSQQLAINSNQEMRLQAEQELIVWQKRMLQKDQQIDTSLPKFSSKRNESNSFHSSSRQTTTSNRRIPAMLNKNENHYNEHDHHEISIKSARVIKRYMELVYHLQSFYERITDQLSNGNSFLKTNQSLFIHHCRKIIEQLQKFKPIWDEKLIELQNQLKDFTSFNKWLIEIEQITFLKRRLTLINLLTMLNKEKELDNTNLSIRTDIDRVLHDDKLAIQLQDELSTLLQHQSLLYDFTSLLHWNCPIYSSNEQNRVENILPILREQMTTTDNYITHVSQQLTELVTDLRSSEKYILSYTNTIPLIDNGIVPSQQSLSNHDHSRSYDKTDLNPIRTREYRLQPSHHEKTNDNSPKIRSTSVPRHMTSDNSISNLDRDDLRISINTNNSNNNSISTRFAAVKSVKREIKPQLNVKSILKSHSQIQSSNGRKTEYDIDRELVRSHKTFDDNERKIFSKPNIHETSKVSSPDNGRRSSFDRKGFSEKRQKTYNLQSMLGDGTKEKSRFVAVKQYSNKSYQQLLFSPNA